MRLHRTPCRRPTARRSALAFLAFLVAIFSLAPAARAAAGSTGGVSVVGTPRVADAVCVTRCVSEHRATPGAMVEVRGAFLDTASAVAFPGRGGEVVSRISDRDRTSVTARVPGAARSGRVYVLGEDGARSNPSPAPLAVLPHSALPRRVFPIRGPHSFGSRGSRFGAPRAGHTHGGQDIAADCGTKLVAVGRSRVRYRAYQASGAGNYVVLHLIGTRLDVVYMHLARRARARPGQVLGAGRLVGYVGATGDATGCHLHFEEWVGPWYRGGHPVNPLPFLRSLDRRS